MPLSLKRRVRIRPMGTDFPRATLDVEKDYLSLLRKTAPSGIPAFDAGYGRFPRQQGNVTQAREYLAKALEIFGRLETLIEPDKVRKALAELPEEP